MTWNKPRTDRQWLLLLTPAAVHLMIVTGAVVHASATGLNAHEGQYLAPLGGAVIGAPIAAVMCFTLACWLSRGASSFRRRVGLALLFTVGLIVVNFGVAYGGCVAFDLTRI